MYVRASIVEQLPDPLSPLFADMIDGAVTRSLQSMFRELLQEDFIQGDRRWPAHGQRVRLLQLRPVPAWAGSCGRLERLSRCVRRGNTQARWRSYSHPQLSPDRHRYWTARNISGLSTDELLAGVQELVDAACRVLHRGADDHPGRSYAARCSWPRSTTRWSGPRTIRPLQVFVLGYDSEPIRAESPFTTSRPPGHHEHLESRLPLPRRNSLSWRPVERSGGMSGTRVSGTPRAYGHVVYNLDFMNPVPADDPVPLLEAVLRKWQGCRSVRAAATLRDPPRGGPRRLGAAGSGTRQRLPSASALGAERNTRSARMRWPMSGWPASGTPHAPRDRSATPAGGRDQRTERRVLVAPHRDRRRPWQPR